MQHNENLVSKFFKDDKDIQQFIQIYEFKSNDEQKNMKQENLDFLGDLIHFYHYTVLPSKPEKPQFPKMQNYNLPQTVFLAHQHFFLQQLLYEYKCDLYDNSTKRIDSIISQLVKLSKTYKIIVDHTLLFYIFSESDKTMQISYTDNALVTEISHDFSFFNDDYNFHDAFMKILNNIIKDSNYSIYGDSDFNFVEDENQMGFERLLFDPSFPLCREINNIFEKKHIKKPKLFTEKVVNLLNASINELKLKGKDIIFAFSLSLFRAIFSSVYPLNISFFFPIRDSKFRKISHKLTLSDIGAPLSILTDLKNSDNVTSASKYREIMESAKVMTICSFMTSPLDVLLYIHKSLSILKKFARNSGCSDDVSSAFESIFGLFMVSLVLSDIPNPEEVLTFAVDFSPQKGLAGPLEYAKSTATAASIHCDAITMQQTIM